MELNMEDALAMDRLLNLLKSGEEISRYLSDFASNDEFAKTCLYAKYLVHNKYAKTNGIQDDYVSIHSITQEGIVLLNKGGLERLIERKKRKAIWSKWLIWVSMFAALATIIGVLLELFA